MSVTRHEVPPLSDGLYYATPVLLADCSESEESDTDTDAQTVIHTSPYSSPGSNLRQTQKSEMQRPSVSPLFHQIFHHYPPLNPPPDSSSRWSSFEVSLSSAHPHPAITTHTPVLSRFTSPTPSTSTPSPLHSLPVQLPSKELGENEGGGDLDTLSIPLLPVRPSSEVWGICGEKLPICHDFPHPTLLHRGSPAQHDN